MKKLIPTLAGSMGITMAIEEDTPKDQLEDYNLIKKIIKLIGDDSEREGVLDTPKRVIKSWKEIYGGYKEDPVKILKTQFNQKYDQMVVLKDIEFYSTCEHHMLPFYGIAHIGYLPKDKVVGLSKLHSNIAPQDFFIVLLGGPNCSIKIDAILVKTFSFRAL